MCVCVARFACSEGYRVRATPPPLVAYARNGRGVDVKRELVNVK